MTIDSGCPRCKYYLEDLCCAAFPRGIPNKILEGLPHDKVMKGQFSDYVFEPED